ncbi:AraC family transcriptional regulator [Hydrocarboniphaga sp.]|uniref:AraC family transcriptional regulator n=1 Tax=Hydrocarboniphaga sp. TaxID=2033016 RepID=UPI00345625A3
MSFWDFKRSTASARLLVEFGRERGMAAEPLLRGSGLSLPQLDDPNTELSAAQELRVIGNLLRLSEGPSRFGIEVGLRYHFSTYGLWGYGLISSATVADALRLALRFLPLTYAFTLITLHEEGELAVLSFGEPDLAPDLRRFLVERDMAAAATLMREIAGPDLMISRLRFRAPEPKRPPKAATELRSLFGTQPSYGAATNSLAFDRVFLPRALPQANPITAAMCHQLCSELLERRRARSSTASLVRQYLSVPGSVAPDLASMARLGNTSERTLKRRLKNESTSFRELLAESRRAMADEMLRDSRLSLTEIAMRLGFADLSSFSQAFKRWHGVAPTYYRKAGAIAAR